MGLGDSHGVMASVLPERSSQGVDGVVRVVGKRLQLDVIEPRDEPAVAFEEPEPGAVAPSAQDPVPVDPDVGWRARRLDLPSVGPVPGQAHSRRMAQSQVRCRLVLLAAPRFIRARRGPAPFILGFQGNKVD